MTEEFERISAIKPWKNVKFNLDRVLKDVPKALISDRRLINIIRDVFNEFKREASHSWSTFRIDGIADAAMSDENAAVMISQLDGIKYFSRVKFTVRV